MTVKTSRHGIPYTIEAMPKRTNKKPKKWFVVFYGKNGFKNKVKFPNKYSAVDFMEMINPENVNMMLANRDHSAFHIYWEW